ncbi:MAG: hypothetical protein M3Y32_06445, partial [Pseudomonadota bacterium]|nr:hypothetical protein [Pseudomonadota bacterium]
MQALVQRGLSSLKRAPIGGPAEPVPRRALDGAAATPTALEIGRVPLRLRSCLLKLRPPSGDLLRDPAYLRLWSSIFSSSFGNQVMMLALPLTAAVLLHATPTPMGLLTAIELAPFILISLPAGVWL